MFARGASFWQRFTHTHTKKTLHISNNDGNRIKTADLEVLSCQGIIGPAPKATFSSDTWRRHCAVVPWASPWDFAAKILNKHPSLLAAPLLFDQPFYCMCCPNVFSCVSAVPRLREELLITQAEPPKTSRRASVESGSFCSHKEENPVFWYSLNEHLTTSF